MKKIVYCSVISITVIFIYLTIATFRVTEVTSSQKDIASALQEITIAVPESTLTVIFIGSSVVRGGYNILTYDQAIPKQVEIKLSEVVGIPVKSYNLALNGSTFFENYYFYRKSIDYLHPDLIVWGFYPARDFKYQYPTRLSRNYWTNNPGEAIKSFSYLDYLFWNEAKEYSSKHIELPASEFMIRHFYFKRKVNFLAEILYERIFRNYVRLPDHYSKLNYL